MKISKDIPMTLYLQVANSIKEDIQSGKIKIGDNIGTQKEICDHFEVSRITIRKALEVLKKQSLITTIHGKGSFAKQKINDNLLVEVKSLPVTLKTNSSNLKVKIIKNETRLVSLNLNNTNHNQIKSLYIERLYIEEKDVKALSKAYIFNKYDTNISKCDLEHHSIYELLENEFGVEWYHADQIIEACPADQELSDIFNIDIESPLLKAKRLVFNKENDLIEKITFYYKYDAFAFKVKMNSIAPMLPTS